MTTEDFACPRCGRVTRDLDGHLALHETDRPVVYAVIADGDEYERVLCPRHVTSVAMELAAHGHELDDHLAPDRPSDEPCSLCEP